MCATQTALKTGEGGVEGDTCASVISMLIVVQV